MHGEPLNESIVSLRDLRRADASDAAFRRSSQLIPKALASLMGQALAVALSKSCNREAGPLQMYASDRALRGLQANPAVRRSDPALSFFDVQPVCLQKDALTGTPDRPFSPESQRCHRLIQRLPNSNITAPGSLSP